MGMEDIKIKLENEVLEAQVSLHGAELKSLKQKAKGTEYMWCADPAYWGRTSPVLFPFVGGVRDKKYRIGDAEYPMGQHGFARDKDFALVSVTKQDAWFALEDDEETRRVYPFPFRLEIGYRLEGRELLVMWRVTNTGTSDMYFAIGAHPAFCCPVREWEKQTDYSICIRDRKGEKLPSFVNRVFGQGGLATDQEVTFELQAGSLPVSEHLFDGDALILENGQAGSVSLADPKGREYLRVSFDAPLVGIWSPPKKQAPFVCIEPWYGRCDREGFDGELKDREWENSLEPGKAFEASYRIQILR